MTLKELATVRRKYLDIHFPYQMLKWTDFDYKVLDNILYRRRPGRGDNESVNDVFIMCDTETSKKYINITYVAPDGTIKYNPVDNHVVAWTISLRALDRNIVTLYGTKPRELCKCIQKIIGNMNGYETIFYWHNMAYDWVFIRQFMFELFGTPGSQLNTKPHYPIIIKWKNGITFKDSLILAQRSLDKWAKDLNVEHQKAIGKWDYDKIRNQGEDFSPEELEYIEHDTLAGVECLDKTKNTLGKQVFSMPFTATGIPREDVRNIGKEFSARDRFKNMCADFKTYLVLEQVYHGGFTHANRHFIDFKITELVSGYDFASSYPYCCLAYKFPMERFTPLSDKSYHYILENAEEYAFIFKLIMIKPRLKNDNIPMPALQFSKAVSIINPILDNGRVLCAEYVEIYLTEIDLEVIMQQYDFDKHICCEVQVAKKEYLPRWLTDYIYHLFQQKTVLKKIKGKGDLYDPVAYALAKAKLNSIYGLFVQKCIKDDIQENYKTGEYMSATADPEELYAKYLKNRNTILPYQWGVWVTAYAFRNLFKLSACCDTHLYSDTDSCYGYGWHIEKVDAYNEACKQLLLSNGYGPVEFNDREYWLGIAEHAPGEDDYTEFKVMGAKRYCGRSVSDNELHITVAGVPKSGSKVLKSIDDFTRGLIFPGTVTGKLTHTYKYVEKIYIDDKGNETGDSIDLTPCDYKLDAVEVVDWEDLLSEEVTIQVYEE